MARHPVIEIAQMRPLITALPATPVRQATQLMSDHEVGAVLVMQNERLVSIFTERDLAFRVIAEGLDPDRTAVAKVATVHPDTLGPRATARDALKLMLAGHYRHLPIVDNGNVIGIVSIRDLYRTIIQSLEDDIILVARHLIRE